jgi:hypothetical protein
LEVAWEAWESEGIIKIPIGFSGCNTRRLPQPLTAIARRKLSLIAKCCD